MAGFSRNVTSQTMIQGTALGRFERRGGRAGNVAIEDDRLAPPRCKRVPAKTTQEPAGISTATS